VRAQALRGQLEAAAGTRGRLEEQRAYRAAGERAAQGGGIARVVLDLLRAVQQRLERLARQAIQGQQVAQPATRAQLDPGRRAHCPSPGTGSASCGAASQRSTITAAATASSAAASRLRRRPSARAAANRCAASIELARSSTRTTGSA